MITNEFKDTELQSIEADINLEEYRKVLLDLALDDPTSKEIYILFKSLAVSPKFDKPTLLNIIGTIGSVTKYATEQEILAYLTDIQNNTYSYDEIKVQSLDLWGKTAGLQISAENEKIAMAEY